MVLKLKNIFMFLTLVSCINFGAFAKEEKKVSGKPQGAIHVNWNYDLAEDASDPVSQFDLTRAYFGYKMTINKNFVGRVMVDVMRTYNVTGANFEASDSSVELSKKNKPLDAYLKYGYLQWKNFIPKSSLTLGLRGRHQWKVQEKFWGYRYISKTLMDLNKYGSSADLGLSLDVKPIDNLVIYFDVCNGEGYKNPQIGDDFYKASLGIHIRDLIDKALSFYIYGDIMPVEGLENQVTAAGFVGYKLNKIFRIAAEYDFQLNHKGVKDTNLNGVSAYTTVTVKKIDIFARYDLFSKDDFETIDNLVIAGLQYAPIKNLKLSPNLQLGLPGADDADPQPAIFINGEFGF